MATVSTAELTNILQKVIDPMLRKLHVPANKSPLVRMWMEGRNGGEGTTTMNGTTFYISSKHSRHSNMQTQAESATLLRGRGRISQPSFTTKTLPGSFTFTLKSKEVSRDRAGAVVDTVMDETEGMLDRAKSMMAFYANNDGTGVVCLVNDGSPNSKTTLTIDTVRATNIAMLLDVGDTLGVGTSAERTAGTGFAATVSSIDSSTQLTIAETTSGTADNDLVFFSEAYDVSGAAETSKMGADGLLATSGTVQGISLSSAYYYHTNLESTAETISVNRVLEYLQITDARVPDAGAFMCSTGNLWWKLASLLSGTTQTDSDRMNKILQGGAKGLRIEWFGGSTPLIHDPFCRDGYVFGLDLHNIGYKQLWPLKLVDDSSQLAHRITQKLEYEVVAAEDGNFYVIDPKSCFKLTGKTTT
jgi:hypothetical protein